MALSKEERLRMVCAGKSALSALQVAMIFFAGGKYVCLAPLSATS